MNDHFGVAIGLENRAAVFEFAAPFGGVGEIAIVADGELAFAAINQDRLRVGEVVSPAVE